MRFWILAGAVALALSACSPGGPVEDPVDDVPSSVASGTREAVYAAQAEGPEAFVRALYAQYVAGGPRGEQPAPGQDPLYSRTLNALIGTDFRAANGEVPTLNYDPLCGCQDQGVFAVTALAVAQSTPNLAEAEVAFTNAGVAGIATLRLVREGPNWRVDDVKMDGKSLHDTLMRVAEAAG